MAKLITTRRPRRRVNNIFNILFMQKRRFLLSSNFYFSLFVFMESRIRDFDEAYFTRWLQITTKSWALHGANPRSKLWSTLGPPFCFFTPKKNLSEYLSVSIISFNFPNHDKCFQFFIKKNIDKTDRILESFVFHVDLSWEYLLQGCMGDISLPKRFQYVVRW